MAISAAAVIAAAADAATSAAVAVGAALGSIGISLSTVVGAVISVGLSAIGNALLGAKKQAATADTTSAADRSQQIRQSVAPHQIILGSVKVSGVLVYIYSPNVARFAFESAVKGNAPADFRPNELLYTALALSGHPVSAIHDITVDDRASNDPILAGLSYVEAALGTVDQLANASFVAETDGEWTVNHRLQGRAALYCIFDYDQSAFTGVPNPAAIVDGAMPYDPRTGETVWSDNPALLIAWYLTQDFGMRLDWDELDEPSLIAAANICDEQVALLDGTSEPRYTCNGTFGLDEAPSDVLDKLKTCMDGGVIFSGGLWYIFAGATVSPSFTITQDMLRGPVVVQANRAARDSFNAVRATYIRPDANWQATDAPVRYDEAAVALDGGTFYTDLDFAFTTSGYTVERLMQIALRRNRAERSISLQMNMSGLCIRPWDVVTFATDRLEAANYRITDWTLQEAGVDLTLELEPDDIYTWDPATDELELGEVQLASLPGSYTLSAPAMTIGTPTAPVPSTVEVSVEAVTASTYAEIQWRPDGQTIWQAAAISGYTAATSPAGVASFRARDRADAQISAWTENDPPDVPTYMLATGVAGGASVEWDTDQPSVQVFTGSGDYSAATLSYSGTASSCTVSATAASAVSIWVRAVNAGGNYSQPIGPVTVTAGNTASSGSSGTPPTSGGGTGGSGSEGGGGE